ncbi:MAG: MGMT family protein, partial [Microbacterium sp.]
EFAVALGRPGAVRAAASVCARNAPALFVPCHRVLRTGGGLGGFAWGVEVKRALLDREGREAAAGRGSWYSVTPVEVR